MYEGSIPFDKDGNPMYYEPWGSDGIDWRPNQVMQLKLELDGYSRGRSSVVFCFVDQNGIQYNMFVSDMVNLLEKKTVDKGVVEGTFVFRKQGANYGLTLHEEAS